MRYLVLLSMFFITSCAVFKNSGGKTNKASKAIAGTSWTLDILADFHKEATQKPVTITFDKEGKVYGSGGCNSYSGTYFIEGKSIKFGPMMSTKMACMEGMKTEDKLFEVFNNTNEYLMTNETLLLKKDGKVLASFNRFKKDK